jgi:hypothetical protein
MIPAFLLIIFAVAYRIAIGLMIHSGTTWLSNFAPMAAIALCGAVYFPPKLKFAVPLGALFISDVILNLFYGASLFSADILGRYVALIIIGGIGLLLQSRASFKTMLPASIVASTLFYFITCAFSWLADPGYTKNLAGLIQAVTIGLPAYHSTPAWMFYRNSLLSDFFFTALFVLCVTYSRTPQSVRAQTTTARTA